MKFVAKEIKGNVNVSRRKPLVDFLYLLGALALILGTIYVLLNFLVILIAPYIPLSVEKKMSALAGDEFTANQVEGKIQQKLQIKLDRMIPLLPEKEQARDYRIVYVESSMVNALALPGGTIVVYSGLYNLLETEAEIDFVLAHELGHYAGRDHIKKLGRAFILFILLTVIGQDDLSSTVISGALRSAELTYSRNQEKNADLFGVQLLYKLNGSYDGVYGFFKTIDKTKDLPELLYYFTTHPSPNRRIKYLEKYINKAGR